MPTLRSPVLERARDTNTVTSTTAGSAPARDPWFDNAKMLLIVLVVLGHVWSQLPATTAGVWAFHFVYLWHMPAFILVSGFLSRSMTWEPARLAALARTVAVPYLVFETALAGFRRLLGDPPAAHLLFVPNSPLWFLLALLAWRLVTPVVLRWPRVPAVTAAIGISLASGAVTGTNADLARILGFLPFFVIGLNLRREDWDRLRTPAAAVAALCVLGLYAAATPQLTDHLPTAWLYFDYPYAALHTGAVAGMMIRLALIAVGVLGTGAFFALVPRVRGWFTTLGSATLIVYLFHPFLIVALGHSAYPGAARGDLGLSFMWPSVAAVALALMLASPPVATRLRVLADPLRRLGSTAAQP